jgi:hypothetical protein
MPLSLVLGLALAAASPAASSPAAALAKSPEEAALLAADARQRDAVAAADGKAIAAIAHPNLLVNAPNNRILTRQDLIDMVGNGEIRNEVFERFPETVRITGDVGVVMGHERVYPGAASEQARMYGRRFLDRRYTNIYLREPDGWRHIARHASIIAAKPGH